MLDEAEAVDNQTEEKAEPTKDETALLTKFSESLKIPAYLQKWYNRFEDDRSYVNEDCMLIDEEDTVATNYILRNQYVVGSQLNYRDPKVSAQPIEQLWGIDPMTGQPLTVPQKTLDFADTNRILVQQQLRWMNFKRVMNGGSQDAMTVGISYLKLRVQEDVMRDPIGYKRENDHLDNVARLQRLMQDFTDEVFDEESSDYKELIDLSNTARQFMLAEAREQMEQTPPMQIPVIDQMTGMPAFDAMGQQMMQADPNDPRLARVAALQQPGPVDPTFLPEVPHFVGYTMEQILPEDVRVDFGAVTRPEDFYDGEQTHIRVYMSKDAIKDKWKVSDDYFTGMKGATAESNKSMAKRKARGSDEDPAKRRDIEADMLDGKYAVWETYYKPTGTVYVWINGCKGFLQQYVPEITWRKWVPVFPLFYNRVTGRFLPISDTRLVMQLQDEINVVRTHAREARKSSYPRFIVKKGLFQKGEKDKFERAAPYSITETTKADQIKDSIHEIAPVKFVAQLYDNSDAIREMEIMMGVTQNAAGGVGGAKFATETAIADKQMAVQSDTRRGMQDDVMSDIINAMVEMNNSLYSEEQVKQIVGQGAHWPALGRSELYYQLKFEVEPGSTGRPDTKKTMDALQNATATVANASAIPGLNAGYLLTEMLKAAECFSIDPKKLFPMGFMPPVPQTAQPPGGGPGDAKGKPAPKSGPEGGAPPMTDPRTPVNMPGSIATQLAG